jgi:hypothetical protein
MAEPVRARRLTDQEGQRLQQIVRRGKHGPVRVRRAMIIMAPAPGTLVPAIARRAGRPAPGTSPHPQRTPATLVPPENQSRMTDPVSVRGQRAGRLRHPACAVASPGTIGSDGRTGVAQGADGRQVGRGSEPGVVKP